MRQRVEFRRWCAGVGVFAAVALALAGCGGGGSSGAAGASGTHTPLLRPASPSGAATSEAPQVTPGASAEAPARSPIALPTADLSRSPRPDPTTTAPPPTTQPPPTTEPPTTEPPTTQPPTRPPITIVPVVPATSPPVTTSAAPSISPTPVSSSSGGSKAWIWVLVALAAVAVVVTAILLVQRRRKTREQWLAWRRTTRPLLDSAMLARTLLPEAARDIDNQAHWRDVQERTEHAARGLESAAMTAPDQQAAGAARDAAAGLRNSVSRWRPPGCCRPPIGRRRPPNSPRLTK